MTQLQPTSDERAFGFLRFNERPAKPRRSGVTEIRGPYYTPMGKRYLEDILETMGVYVDALKFAGGSFSLMPRNASKSSSISATDMMSWSPLGDLSNAS